MQTNLQKRFGLFVDWLYSPRREPGPPFLLQDQVSPSFSGCLELKALLSLGSSQPMFRPLKEPQLF